MKIRLDQAGEILAGMSDHTALVEVSDTLGELLDGDVQEDPPSDQRDVVGG